jgi:hypothetical protein
MFNIGGDDKEKLEENMEEIKNLISNDQNRGNQQQQGGEESGNALNEIGQGSDDQAFDEADSEDFPDLEENKDLLEESETDNTGQMENPQPNQAEGEKIQQNASQRGTAGVREDAADASRQPNQNRNTSTNAQRDTSAEQGQESVEQLQNEIKGQISSLEEESQRREETAEGQSEEDPLFLDVERFEDIRDMVEEMHYLTTEMDDVMENLSAGIQQDQETAGEANQIVDEFQARRDKIEQILRDN